MRRDSTRDRRGVASVVNHVLAIGITTILITGLLVAGGTYLESQQEYAATTGLNTVGNELAETITQLQRLSAGSGNATIRTDLPERVSGASYSVQIVNGSECDELQRTPASCLELESSSLDIVENIPLAVNETAVEISTIGPSHYRLDWNESVAVRSAGTEGPQNLPLRLGIGGDVARQRTGQTIIGTTNLPPTNVTFTVEPEYPDTSREVTFTANAVDPDPEDPNNPGLNYSWDFDEDGVYERQNMSSNTATYEYGGGNYGLYNVSLRVTDEDNASTWDYQNVTVAGLEALSLTRTPTADRQVYDETVSFTGDNVSVRFRNTHSDDIEIVGLYLDHQDTGQVVAEEKNVCIDYDTDWRGDRYCDTEVEVQFPEILVDSNDDGDYDDPDDEEYNMRYPTGSGCEAGIEIREGGLAVSSVYEYYETFYSCSVADNELVSVAVDGSGSPDNTVQITFQGVEGLSTGEDFTIGVQYRVNGEPYTTRFTEEVGGLP